MSLQAESALALEIPADATPRRQRARHLLTKLVLQRRPPWHELETKTIVDHGEPPRRERDALAIDAGDVFTFDRRAMGEPCVGR